MAGFVDIHAHVLPGIDDGPASLGEALEMARAAADSGIATIAATPHLRPDFPDVHVNEVADRCVALQRAIDDQGIPIRVVCGAEASLTWALGASEDSLALASYGQHGTDLLIEIPTTGALNIDRFVYPLRAKGYRLTLGHPERNLDFQHDHTRLRELAEQGVLLQVNADSLLGFGGRRTQALASRLLTEGIAHAIGSDGHRGISWRPVTQFAKAFQAATQLVGRERAEWMAEGVPAAIISGADLPAAPEIVSKPARSVFGFRRR